jgi:hypothetical protein
VSVVIFSHFTWRKNVVSCTHTQYHYCIVLLPVPWQHLLLSNYYSPSGTIVTGFWKTRLEDAEEAIMNSDNAKLLGRQCCEFLLPLLNPISQPTSQFSFWHFLLACLSRISACWRKYGWIIQGWSMIFEQGEHIPW